MLLSVCVLEKGGGGTCMQVVVYVYMCVYHEKFKM